MDEVARENIESSLVYSAIAAYLLRSTSYSKLAATAYLFATTLLLRPRPHQSDFLKNGIYSLCHLVDGYLFWKVVEPLLHLKELSEVPLNPWTVGTGAWTALRSWDLLRIDNLSFKQFKYVSDRTRKTVETNLFYSTLFALSLNSSYPKIGTALLALGTTFFFRPDEQDKYLQGKWAHRATFALAHLGDAYLFCQLACLSQGSFKQLLTSPWTGGASLWYTARLYTIFFPTLEKKLNQWTKKYPLLARSTYYRWRWQRQERLKYGALFALCMHPSYFNRFSVGLALATALFLNPPSPGNYPTLRQHVEETFIHIANALFFWQVVVPLSSVRQIGQLSARLCLGTVGAVLWTALI